MIRIFSLIVLTYCVVLGVSHVSTEESSKKFVKSCYNDVVSPYIKFSSKTAYRVNQNKNTDNLERLDEGMILIMCPGTHILNFCLLSGCHPKQFWLLSRHGTRNPGTKDMKKLQEKLPLIFKQIKSNMKEGRGSLCEDDIIDLEAWKFIANVTEDKYLVDEGVRELKGLGYRFQKRFPSLLTKPFVNESYVVNLP